MNTSEYCSAHQRVEQWRKRENETFQKIQEILVELDEKIFSWIKEKENTIFYLLSSVSARLSQIEDEIDAQLKDCDSQLSISKRAQDLLQNFVSNSRKINFPLAVVSPMNISTNSNDNKAHNSTGFIKSSNETSVDCAMNQNESYFSRDIYKTENSEYQKRSTAFEKTFDVGSKRPLT